MQYHRTLICVACGTKMPHRVVKTVGSNRLTGRLVKQHRSEIYLSERLGSLGIIKAPLKLIGPSQDCHIEKFKGGPQLGPYYAERCQPLGQRMTFFSSLGVVLLCPDALQSLRYTLFPWRNARKPPIGWSRWESLYSATPLVSLFPGQHSYWLPSYPGLCDVPRCSSTSFISASVIGHRV